MIRLSELLVDLIGEEQALIYLLVSNYTHLIDTPRGDILELTNGMDPDKLLKAAIDSCTCPLITAGFTASGLDENNLTLKIRSVYSYFQEARTNNLVRSSLGQAQIREIAHLFRSNDIKFTLIKGSARLFDNLWPEIEDREMNDLDIVVSKSQNERAYELLLNQGYYTSYKMEDFEDSHQFPPLYHEKALFPVELHRTIGKKRLEKQTGPTEKLPRMVLPDLNLHVYENWVQHIHCIEHGSANMFGGSQYWLPVRDMVEAALLRSRANKHHQGRVDFDYPARVFGVLADVQSFKSVSSSDSAKRDLYRNNYMEILWYRGKRKLHWSKKSGTAAFLFDALFILLLKFLWRKNNYLKKFRFSTVPRIVKRFRAQ